MSSVEGVLEGRERWWVEGGDCRDLLRLLPDECIDAVVTDPPYEIGFMSAGWDRTGIAFDVEMWKQVLRVCKPGVHLLSFGGNRTYHRMACAVEDAGWEIRDQIDWIYGEGMPHGTDISKAIDKSAGAVRRVIGQRKLTGSAALDWKEKGGTYGAGTDSRGKKPKIIDITEPATEAAKAWDGWGTGLKPGHEPVVLARKPFRGSVQSNVTKHGAGAINVDACRIAAEGRPLRVAAAGKGHIPREGVGGSRAAGETSEGRWPANVVFSHAEGCECIGRRKVKAAPSWNDNRPPSSFTGSETSPVHHGDPDGTETVEVWSCVPWCPVGMLEGGGEGGAVRYFNCFPYEPLFYEPKADRDEREKGCEGLPAELVGDGRQTLNDTPYQRGKTPRRNTHTTVKPVGITRWLSRLITRPGGLILDPFAGSGTGGISALADDFRWLGFDNTPKHVEIARSRILGDAPLFNRHALGGRL